MTFNELDLNEAISKMLAGQQNICSSCNEEGGLAKCCQCSKWFHGYICYEREVVQNTIMKGLCRNCVDWETYEKRQK
jgi:hypothetical protein